jgi:hypothetical protein
VENKKKWWENTKQIFREWRENTKSGGKMLKMVGKAKNGRMAGKCQKWCGNTKNSGKMPNVAGK